MATEPNDKIRITCPDCNKTYRIRKRQIPLGATAVRCKACGRHVKLMLNSEGSGTKGNVSHSPQSPDARAEKASVAAPRCRLDLMTEEKRPRPHRKNNRSKKPWTF